MLKKLKIKQFNKKEQKFYEKLILEGIDEFLAKYIVDNNIENYNYYFSNDFSQIEKPEKIKDLEKGVNLFLKHIKNKNKILIVGDYDTDGVTSSALLYLFCKEKYNIKLDCYIPERIEGYGLSTNIIQYAINHQYDCIITVDNGIVAFDAVDLAIQNNIDIIITDHHETQNNKIPNAHAVINPIRKDSEFYDKKLAGVGVIWNFCRFIDEELSYKYLPLVAIGTVADVVPLINENRMYVKEGLKFNQNNLIFSLKIIYDFLDIKNPKSESYGFKIAPRLNSAGRMGEANLAYQILISEDYEDIKEKWLKIEELNIQRKEKQTLIFEDIFKNLDLNQKYILMKPKNMNYLPSIVGIVGSQLVELYSKPTIIFGKKDESKSLLSGSGRGVSWFNFIPLIEKLKEMGILISGGGHKLAAGFTIDEKDFDTFETVFKNFVEETYQEKIEEDILDILNLPHTKNETKNYLKNMLNKIKLLEPFGEKNEFPSLAIKLTTMTDMKRSEKRPQDLQMRLSQIYARGWNICHNGLPEFTKNDYVKISFDEDIFETDEGNKIPYFKINIKEILKS